MPLLIGISGLCGSGKSTAVEFLEGKAPSPSVIYLGGMILKKLADEGLERTAENEIRIQNEIRQRHGAAALAVLAAPAVSDAFRRNQDVVIDAIFSPEEYEYILTNCAGAVGTTLAIHSSLHIRCDRLAKRRNRPLTSDQVLARDRNEVLNLGASRAITLAAHHIVNNGAIPDFYRDLDNFLTAVRS